MGRASPDGPGPGSLTGPGRERRSGSLDRLGTGSDARALTRGLRRRAEPVSSSLSRRVLHPLVRAAAGSALALALLAGAVGLASPVSAETEVWSATVTVGSAAGGLVGYASGSGGFGSISDDSFDFEGTTYTVQRLQAGTQSSLNFTTDQTARIPQDGSVYLKLDKKTASDTDWEAALSAGTFSSGTYTFGIGRNTFPTGHVSGDSLTVRLIDKRAPTGPTVTIAAGTSPVTEGTAAAFTVSANPAPGADLTVNLSVTDAPDADYLAAGNEGSKTVTISSGSTNAVFSVATQADSADEANGPVKVEVASGTGYAVGTASSASVTVNDNDDLPRLEFDPGAATVREDAGKADLTVTLSPASDRQVTVDFSTSAGLALGPEDYTSVPETTVNFAPGDTSKTVSVPIVDDAIFEPAQAFFGNLKNPQNATVGNDQATISIIDNDPAPVVTIGDATVDEGAGTAEFEVTLTTPARPQREVSVKWSTANGTAVAPGDYTTVPKTTLAFSSTTSRTQKVAVTIVDDLDEEPDETFTVVLSDPDGATLGDPHTGTGTIRDNDATAATFSSATVDGDSLVVTFSESLSESSVPGHDAFHVTVGTARRNVASGGVSIAGAEVTLTLVSAVTPADTVKVRYTKPGTNPLRDLAGNDVEAFPDRAVCGFQSKVITHSTAK